MNISDLTRNIHVLALLSWPFLFRDPWNPLLCLIGHCRWLTPIEVMPQLVGFIADVTVICCAILIFFWLMLSMIFLFLQIHTNYMPCWLNFSLGKVDARITMLNWVDCRCQGEDGADHSNPGNLLSDGEWEITTQLDLLPAHALKLRQVSPGMVHREESLTLVCRPHEAKLEQVRNSSMFLHWHSRSFIDDLIEVCLFHATILLI